MKPLNFVPHIPASPLLWGVGIFVSSWIGVAWFLRKNASTIVKNEVFGPGPKYDAPYQEALEKYGGGASILQDRDGNPIVLPLIL